MFFRLLIETGAGQLVFYADDVERMETCLLQGLHAMTASGRLEEQHARSWCRFQARRDQKGGPKPVYLERLKIFVEMAGGAHPDRDLETTAGFREWCQAMWAKARRLIDAQGSGFLEAHLATERAKTPAGSVLLTQSGCGGAGCMDMTCPYCCQDFADPEDVGPSDEELAVVHTAPMVLLPPAPGVCRVCATDHPPEQSHNQESLYYQTAFYMQHQRYPTWTDALAHCTQEMRRLWVPHLVELLKKHDREIPPDVQEMMSAIAAEGATK